MKNNLKTTRGSRNEKTIHPHRTLGNSIHQFKSVVKDKTGYITPKTTVFSNFFCSLKKKLRQLEKIAAVEDFLCLI